MGNQYNPRSPKPRASHSNRAARPAGQQHPKGKGIKREPGPGKGPSIRLNDISTFPDDQQPQEVAWLSPLDLLDYLGLGVDLLERAYIEIYMEPGQEKEFKLFINTLYIAIDVVLATLPGAGGGGLGARASHDFAVAAWQRVPVGAKAEVIQNVGKQMGWSAAKASQAITVFFSMKSGKGNGGDRQSGRENDVSSKKTNRYSDSNIDNLFREVTPKSVLEKLSNNSKKHAKRHLSEFQKLDPNITEESLRELGASLVKKENFLKSSKANQMSFEKIIDIGGTPTRVRVVLNESDKLLSVQIRWKK
ncbi:MAG: hypothetical protein WA902_07210 [Thermosynechococcaceae cyanobacterium]